MNDYTPSLREIFTMFLTIGSTSFGGAIPWARHYLVDKKQWMGERTFTDMITICQTAPGPNILNVAVYFGYKNRGLMGCGAAMLGLLVVPFFITLSLALLFRNYLDAPQVRSALVGMTCAAAGFMFSVAVKLSKPFSRNALAMIVCIGTIALGLVLHWSLPLILLSAGTLSIALAFARKI